MDNIKWTMRFKICLWIYLYTFVCISKTVHGAPSYNRLNNVIRHYEPVMYDVEALHQEHHRVKRFLDIELQVPINVFGIKSLSLVRDVGTLADDLVVEIAEGEVLLDVDRTYKGVVTGIQNSSAYGVICSEGFFEGKFTADGEHYAVERASRFFEKPDFHTLVYRHSDIETEKIKSKSTCASQDLFEKTRDNLHQTANEEATGRTVVYHENHADDAALKYHAVNNRQKRAIDNTKTQCTLYIESDHLYYAYWGSNDEAVLNQFAIHVQGINEIYEITDFDEDGSGDGISFIVKRVKLWKSSSESGYKFPSNYDVETFLTMFSDDSDFDAYCLAYIFTYRDFDGGTLGLAWTGSTSSAGGVCERMGTFGGQQKALNAGLVSVLNYGEDMPFLISRLTFAHEVGHNMGSPHDTEGDSTCAPGGDSGNYIMYPKATDGNKENNIKFSICSIRSMHPVMTQKARDDADGCFIVPLVQICGNGVVEDGEQCDCGYAGQCDDTCCVPQTDAGDPAACTLVGGAACSATQNSCQGDDCERKLPGFPTQGPCCGSDCQLIETADNVTCRTDNGCIDVAICNGSGVNCPDSENKPDLSICSATKVCLSGECAGSLCLIHNKTECQCAPTEENDWTDERLCRLCCKDSTDQTCYDSYELDAVPNTDQIPGAPCNEYEGYCDVFLKCREVIPDGILNQLLSINAIKAWFKSNWYFILIGFLLLIVLLILMVKFCTPKKKSDKSKKKNKKKDNKVAAAPQKKGHPPRGHAFTPPKAKPNPGGNLGPSGVGPYPYQPQPYGAVPYPGGAPPPPGYPSPYMGGGVPPMGGMPPPMPGAVAAPMVGPPPDQMPGAQPAMPVQQPEAGAMPQ